MLLNGLLAGAQVTNPIASTNSLAEINPLAQANALPAASDPALTNSPLLSTNVALSNNLVQTNVFAQTNSLQPSPAALATTNSLTQTNALSETNIIARATDFTETNALRQTNGFTWAEEPSRANGSNQTTGPGRLDFSSFRIIAERNIFDPNRSPRGRRFERRDDFRPARVDAFSLLGTMSYENGQFAFFDGTSSEYRKVLKPADSIAGYKITEIAPKDVKLAAADGKVLELPVGMQLRREEEGEWVITARTESYGSSGGTPPASTVSSIPVTNAPSQSVGTNAETAAASSGGGESDILKRLMQRREQELNR